jgi:predicted dehydrogenase
MLAAGAVLAQGIGSAQEAPSKQVRVGLAGMAHVHAGGYADHVARAKDRARITCVWDDDPQRGRPVADAFKVPYVSKLEELLKRDDVDGIVCSAETSKHHDVFMAATARKKHIFTEKALTITTKDADEVVRAVKQSGIKFMISLPQRSSRETLFCKQMIDGGYLGQVTLMRARVAHSAALDGWFSGGSAWFGDPKLAGGGALFDLGCHVVDVMRWYLGQPSRVMAMVNNVTGKYPIDDNSAAICEFKNKALGMLDVSWVHRDGPNMWEIYGTEGYVLRGAPGKGLDFSSNRFKKDATDPDPAKVQAPPAAMDQWLNAILTDSPMTITVDDGRNLTQMLEAIYTSSKQNKAVTFS